MRGRLAAAISAALLMSVVGAGSSSAHDDGKGGVHPPGQHEQAQEFANVVAAKANERSNAPRSFAPCIKGMAAKTYPCSGVDMMSHLTLADLGLSFANDIWGWTDSATGREYAIIGGTEGTVFVDISDAKRPDVVGILPTHSTEGGQFWRDIKVHADHAYVVSEHTDHGLQVFDLTRLRGVTGPAVEFAETAHYDGFGSAHNLNINEDSGFAYAVGTDTCAGGLHVVDLSDPAAPVQSTCFAEHGYIHDTQCVIYTGPDARYSGREICFNSNAEIPGGDFSAIQNALSIVDMTDKTNPVPLSRVLYEDDGYSHQGWLTPDQATFLHGDELDELFGQVAETTTRIWDVTDLTAPFVEAVYGYGTTSIDHNIYTKGDRAFASNYTSGLRILDTSAAGTGQLSEVGYFDLYPENDAATFEGGTWSNYPYYDSGVVAVSSMDRGLFVLKPRGNVGR